MAKALNGWERVPATTKQVPPYRTFDVVTTKSGGRELIAAHVIEIGDSGTLSFFEMVHEEDAYNPTTRERSPLVSTLIRRVFAPGAWFEVAERIEKSGTVN
jgi:hypothetical protein